MERLRSIEFLKLKERAIAAVARSHVSHAGKEGQAMEQGAIAWPDIGCGLRGEDYKRIAPTEDEPWTNC